jgi:hypothetical protein
MDNKALKLLHEYSDTWIERRAALVTLMDILKGNLELETYYPQGYMEYVPSKHKPASYKRKTCAIRVADLSPEIRQLIYDYIKSRQERKISLNFTPTVMLPAEYQRYLLDKLEQPETSHLNMYILEEELDNLRYFSDRLWIALRLQGDWDDLARKEIQSEPVIAGKTEAVIRTEITELIQKFSYHSRRVAGGFDLGEIRGMLQEAKPSVDLFSHLMLTLNSFTDEDLHTHVLDYTKNLLAQWPISYRTGEGLDIATLRPSVQSLIMCPHTLEAPHATMAQVELPLGDELKQSPFPHIRYIHVKPHKAGRLSYRDAILSLKALFQACPNLEEVSISTALRGDATLEEYLRPLEIPETITLLGYTETPDWETVVKHWKG